MNAQTPIMQRPILKRVEYHVSALPIERLFRSEEPCVTRAYSALLRNGISTIGDLIDRAGDVPVFVSDVMVPREGVEPSTSLDVIE